MKLRVALMLVLVAAVAPAQQTQNQAKGFSADKVYQFNDIDHVNLFNGALNITIPIGPTYVVSSTLSYRFMLTYAGNNWDYYANTYTEQFPTANEDVMRTYPFAEPADPVKMNAGLGWLLSLGRLLGPGETVCGCYSFQSPDGAMHQFSSQLHRDSSEPVSMNVWYTNDGSYIRMTRRYTDPEDPLSAYYEVETGDGTLYEFSLKYELRFIRDRFGNFVEITRDTIDGAPRWTISDRTNTGTLLRTHTIEFKRIMVVPTEDSDPVKFDVVKTVRLASFDGTSAAFTFSYGGGSDNASLISRPYINNLDCQVGPGTYYPILTKVALPDGSAFDMSYDLGDGGGSYSKSGGDPLIGLNAPCQSPQINAITGFSGNLTQLKLPTGGRMEWSYREWLFPPQSVGGGSGDAPSGVNIAGATASRSIGVATRIERDRSGGIRSQRSYSSDNSIPDATSIVTVTTLGDDGQPFSRSRHYFALNTNQNPPRAAGEYGLPFTRRAGNTTSDYPLPNPDAGGRYLSHILYDAAGRMMRAQYVAYEGDEFMNTNIEQANRRESSSRTIWFDPATETAVHETTTVRSDFDGVGHHRTVVTDGTAAGGGARSETTAWNRLDSSVDPNGRDTGTYPSTFVLPSLAEPWILNTWSTRAAHEAGTNTATVRAHAWFEPNTGSLRRTRTLAGESRAGHDLVTELTHAGGNITREDQFGGDVTPEDAANGIQPLSTSQPLATMTLPQRRYRVQYTYSSGVRNSSQLVDAAGNPLSFKTLDLTIDPNSGLPIESRDTAGLVTTFSYDTSGRLASISPPAVAATTYAYQNAVGNDPARVTITRADTVQVVHFDDFGHVWREMSRMPPLAGTTASYLTMRETRYNAMGWKASVSETEQVAPVTNDPTSAHTTFSPAKKTTYSGYDVFGRPASVLAADGKHTDFAYSDMAETRRTVWIASQLNAADQPFETIERYDRHGRLFQVAEPSGPSTNTTTTYGYDNTSRLISASTESLGVVQQRLFQYDNRGFLLAERHPERGVAGNGWTTYGGQDAQGNARSKVDGIAGGAFDLRMTYDAAGRLTKVEEPLPGTSARRTVKEYTFGTPVNGANANGKLLTATRHHDDLLLNGRVSVTETYQYNGLGGRPSMRTTTIAGTSIVPGRTFTQEQSYDAAHGGVESVRYPSCAGCGGFTDQAWYSYQNGLPKDVAGYASFAYHPNGLLSRVAHANGATDSWEADASGIPRPQSITAKDANSVVLWTSGQYSYDGAGNISRIGTQSYLYDGVSRLAEEPRANGRLLYRYDAFGNLLGQSNEAWHGDGFSRIVQDFGIDPQTNRMRSDGPAVASYDETGNLTAWSTGTQLPRLSYTASWDSVGTMHSLTTFDTPPPPANPIRQNAQHFLYTADGERVAIIEFDGGGIRRSTKWTLRGFDHQLLRTYVDDAVTGWAWVDDNVHGGGKLLGNVSASAGSRQYTVDHLGSPRIVTNSGGLYAGEQAFKSFGAGGATGAGALQFTSHERDWMANGESIDYMHGRYYSASLGRFLSTDPVLDSRGAMTHPQGWHRYAYVTNNPAKFTDADGRECGGCLAFERDVRDLQAGRMSTAEYNQRLQARGWGAVIGASPWASWVTAGSLNELALHVLLRLEIAKAAAAAGTAEALRRAASSSGPTIQVLTNLTQAPQEGRALSAAAGPAGQALANAARNGQGVKTFAAQIPQALMNALLDAKMVEVRTTMMNGVQATEYRFSPAAAEYVARLFQEISARVQQ